METLNNWTSPRLTILNVGAETAAGPNAGEDGLERQS
jgi:hypothetical protein